MTFGLADIAVFTLVRYKNSLKALLYKHSDVTVTATTLLTTGVFKNAISIAIDLVQGRANTESVVTLMQNLQRLVQEDNQEDNQVNIAQLNQAITAYNRIVDTSDLATLETLKTMPAFLNIKELLKGIQNSDL